MIEFSGQGDQTVISVTIGKVANCEDKRVLKGIILMAVQLGMHMAVSKKDYTAVA